MAYTTNPRLPKLRARAVEMVRSGKTVTEVARYFGYSKGAVSKWCKKYPSGGAWIIPTESSRPKHHPKQLNNKTVQRIKELRGELNGRCAEVITKHLAEEGFKVARISVQRTLDRLGLTKKRSPWKRFHLSGIRPNPVKPGSLVQLDTIHLMKTKTERIYVYTLIDVYSRWCFAWATERISTRYSIKFLMEAQRQAGFAFQVIQTDHGPEFTQHFTENIQMVHRHSRVRKPNDNAHVERFNRTIQAELISKLSINTDFINNALPKYLDYYNTKRYHLGINLKTPAEMLV
jgi:transposase InsO family protein